MPAPLALLGGAALRGATAGGVRGIAARSARNQVLLGLLDGKDQEKPRPPQITMSTRGINKVQGLLTLYIDYLDDLPDAEAADFYKELRKKTPVRTGFLKRSTRLVSRQQITIGAYYARYVNNRTGYIDRAKKIYHQRRRRRWQRRRK